jgi:hypothetical protein
MTTATSSSRSRSRLAAANRESAGRVLPAEWRSAWQTLSTMNRVAGPVGPAFARSLLGFVLPFAAGSLPALWFMPKLVAVADKEVSIAVIAGVLAFGGLLVGFIATLMLFTGRLEHAAALTLEQIHAFAERLKYLLASQAMTLFCALVLSLLCVLWMGAVALGVSALGPTTLGVVLAGFASVSFCRMWLLPIQIFELHEAWLDLQIADKIRETRARYDEENG